MGAFTTYQSGGVYDGSGVAQAGYVQTRREFLLDQISYKYPSETPLWRMLPKIPLDTVRPEWGLGTLEPTLSTIQSSPENYNFGSSPNPSGARKRAGTYTQIQTKVIEVTDTQRLMDEIGTTDEYSLQVWKKSRELMMEMENSLNFARASEGTASSPTRTTHGLFSWLYDTGDTSGTVTIAGHPIPETYSAVYTTPGSAQDLTLDDLIALTKSCWDNGLDVSRAIMMCGGSIYQLISRFALATFGTTPDIRTVSLNDRNIPAEARALEDVLEVYRGPFGSLHINKNRYYTSRSGPFATFGPTGNQITLNPENAFAIFEPEHLAIGILQGLHVRPAETTSLSSLAALACQFAFICRDPRGLAGGHNWLAP